MAFHEPYYTTQSSPALAVYFQQHLESLFYSSAVDVVVNGHIHACERSYPVYNGVVRTICSTALGTCSPRSNKRVQQSLSELFNELCDQRGAWMNVPQCASPQAPQCGLASNQCVYTYGTDQILKSQS